MPDPILSIATYARVSSDEQRDRHTVRNQRSALSRRLGSEPGVFVFRHYEDDGVSGTIPLEDRPAGGPLARDARAGRFSQIWVVRADRLGRDELGLFHVRRLFDSLDISLHATDENIDDAFTFGIQAVVAAHERRKFLERSAEGMNRAARDGRYTGGIVPLGYTVAGDRGARRLVPDDSPMWAGLSAAAVVRRIYNHLAVDGWSCKRIAKEFNDLGIPTAYRRAGRGVRGKRTRETWHSGHVRNLVRNTVYKGVLQYGRRSSKPNGREVISARVAPLVSEDVWDAAIATLNRNRIIPNNSRHTYLLRSLIRCAVCGLAFCGTWARTAPRYRCNGAMVERGPFPGKCIGASIKGDLLETTVWSDISRFLSDPGSLIDELLAESDDAQTRAAAEAERSTLIAARDAARDRRFRALDIYTRGKIPESDFDAITAEVDRELNRLDERLAALEPPKDDPSDAVASEDLLSEIRNRLDGGLTQAQRQEIVQLLVRRITVHTTLSEQGRKQRRIAIDYRLPSAATTGTVIAASHSYNLSRVIAA